jgi:hypothetical protein
MRENGPSPMLIPRWMRLCPVQGLGGVAFHVELEGEKTPQSMQEDLKERRMARGQRKANERSLETPNGN